VRHIVLRPYLKQLLQGERDLLRSTLNTITYASRRPAGPVRGHVLLSYVLEPFLVREGGSVYRGHTNHAESLQIAQIFLDVGYAVDVFDYRNLDFLPPRRDYTFLVDKRHNLERLSPLMDGDCIKIMHIDSAHITFQRYAEAKRLLDLKSRRGIALPPFTTRRTDYGIEHADYGTSLGGEFTMATYRYAGKPLYPVPVAAAYQYPWPEDKDFEGVRRRFLWFGGRALVLKGLDLVLEAFAGMPEYELVVCGPLDRSPEFQQAYYRELYETPNIQTVGWVDVGSREFTEIANRCLGLIFPSCSEGQAGGVVTCMHAGLIPLVSYESGVDVEDFGEILARSDLEEIGEVVRRASERPVEGSRRRARAAWEYARAHHTPEAFARKYRESIEDIMRRRGMEVVAGTGEGEKVRIHRQ